MKNKTVVMTGGTSGIGERTVRKFLSTKDFKVILGVRNNKIIPGTETIALDLTSLNDVRSFASEVIKKLGTDKINSLVLNAGISSAGIDSRTIDGFETTFAVNHLAHYMLVRILLPYMAKNSVIVITTSGTHDPVEGTMMSPPKHAKAILLAHPENDTTLEENPQSNASRAYSSSKLCNILTARYLATLPEIKKNQIHIVAYNPGPTPGTGLARNRTLSVRLVWNLLSLKIFRFFLPFFNSRKVAGEILADISMGVIQPPESKVYASLKKGKITWPFPSELAQNDQVMIKLWNDSAKIAGI